ncbi:hypothetical protein MMC21_003599 [Puttea exsequens]|nr:hypothetical protein [Puttea exsequens]
MPTDDTSVQDDLACQATVQAVKLKIRRVEGLSAILTQGQPGWSDMAKRFITWYDGVERVLKSMFSSLGVEVITTYNAVGRQQHHENTLEELSRSDNPFLGLLGRDEVIASLRGVKDQRNVFSGYSKSIIAATPPPDWHVFTAKLKGIESILWSTLACFRHEYRRHKDFEQTLSMEKQRLEDWQKNLQEREQSLQDLEVRLRQSGEQLEAQHGRLEMVQDRNAREKQRLKAEEAEQRKRGASLKKECKVIDVKVKKMREDLAAQKSNAREVAKEIRTKTQLKKENKKLEETLKAERQIQKGEDELLDTLQAENKSSVEIIGQVNTESQEVIENLEIAYNKCLGFQKVKFRSDHEMVRDADAQVAQSKLKSEVTKVKGALRVE